MCVARKHLVIAPLPQLTWTPCSYWHSPLTRIHIGRSVGASVNWNRLAIHPVKRRLSGRRAERSLTSDRVECVPSTAANERLPLIHLDLLLVIFLYDGAAWSTFVLVVREDTSFLAVLCCRGLIYFLWSQDLVACCVMWQPVSFDVYVTCSSRRRLFVVDCIILAGNLVATDFFFALL